VPDKTDAEQSVTMEAFGVTIEITASGAHLEAVRDVLPPGARQASGRPDSGRFALVAGGGRGLVDLRCDDQSYAGLCDLGVAIGMLDAQIRMHIALHAPDHVFVHAGVVGVDDRAIVLPGRSFAGKTTLVAALVAAGAEYWSDEYAALDRDGLVHPYAKPLSIRGPDQLAEDRTVESLGGCAGERPLRVALIAFAQYRLGGSWAPSRRSAGEGAIKLLEHTVPARSRPDESLLAVRRAATDARILEGERGEAKETAAALIAELRRPGARRAPATNLP